MRIEDLNERLRQTILVADGAMGSALVDSVGHQRCLDELNTTNGEEVFRVHQAYIEAGAQIIETNTFGANRAKLGAFGLGERVTELNHRGVKIAREAREAAQIGRASCRERVEISGGGEAVKVEQVRR